MRVVVAGGAGFLGSHFCERLLGEGHEVVCLDNLLTGDEANLATFAREPRFRFERVDISEPFTVAGPVDEVANFASPASPIDYAKLPIETLRVGSFGTFHCLELARAKGAGFLITCTSEAYGDPLVHPQREDYWGNVNPVGRPTSWPIARANSRMLVSLGLPRLTGSATVLASRRRRPSIMSST